jgi:hypothetical protein
MMSGAALAAEFARRADPVDPSSKSTTKWEPIDRLIAEALDREDEDVYTTTISKAGNVTVRTTQSKTAGASVIVAMWAGEREGPSDFDRTIKALRRHLYDRTLVLVARRANGPTGWAVAVALSTTGTMPRAIGAAWPSAIAMSY